MEVNGQPHVLASLSLGKQLVLHIAQEAGWAPELVWMLWNRGESLALLGSEPLIVQPVT
jgi:hypothetical protein